VIGIGEFGLVLKGELNGDVVAIKTLKGGEGSEYRLRSLFMELKVLNYLKCHPNIVELRGAYIEEYKRGVLRIALEYCSLGDLLNFLKLHRQHFVDSFHG